MSDHRLQAAARAVEIAVHPYAAQSADRWLHDVYEAVGKVLETERGYAILQPAEGAEHRLLRHVPTRTLQTYVEEFFEQDVGSYYAKQLGGAYTSAQLFAAGPREAVDAFRHSAVWNEYYIPNELSDGAGFWLDELGGTPHAMLYINFGIRDGRPFAEHDLSLLRAIKPALLAGATEWAVGAGTWQRSLEAAGAALIVLNERGRELFRTPAAIEALRTMPHAQRAAWDASVRRDALNLLATGRRAPAPSLVRDSLGVGRMTIVSHGGQRLVLVRLLVPRSAVPLHLAQHLTPGERRLADALVQGRTAHEIANETGRSHHAVRRGIERLYAKLGVHRRAQLVKLITGQDAGAPGDDPHAQKPRPQND